MEEEKQLVGEVAVNGYPSPDSMMLSFESLWNVISSFNLNADFRQRLAERLMLTTEVKKPYKAEKKRRLIISEKIRQLAGSLPMEVTDDWKADKAEYLFEKYIGHENLS